MDYLTDLQKEKIMNFNEDEVLVEAVRKVFLASIYSNGTLRAGEDSDPSKNAALALAFLAIKGNGVVTNADLGEDLRGMAQGISLLESGFKQLLTIKRQEKPEEVPVNPGI